MKPHTLYGIIYGIIFLTLISLIYYRQNYRQNSGQKSSNIISQKTNKIDYRNEKDTIKCTFKKVSNTYKRIDQLTFSPTSDRFFFKARKDNKIIVVEDSRESSAYN
jgi:hypothetical protein